MDVPLETRLLNLKKIKHELIIIKKYSPFIDYKKLYEILKKGDSKLKIDGYIYT